MQQLFARLYLARPEIPFFVFVFYQVSETNDPLEDIKSLFEPTTDSIQEQENRTSSFKGVFLFYFLFFLTD